jgi:hypothetical protein
MESGTIEPPEFAGGLETPGDNPGNAFNIALAYQDTLTRAWASELCVPLTQKFGIENFQPTWHDINALREPDNLLHPVRAALGADVIVVSVHAAEELPVELYAWIDAWLPRRISRVGALAALIGVTEQPDAHATRTHQYLQAVARRGQMDFIPYEHRLQDEARRFSRDPAADPNEPARYIRLTANGQTEFRF